MKTQEQIQERINFLWERIKVIEQAIDEKNASWFPNRGAITYLRKIASECKAEIVHLSWVI